MIFMASPLWFAVIVLGLYNEDNLQICKCVSF